MNSQKLLKYFFAAIVLGNIALVIYVVLGVFSPKTPPHPMPNPNGYDDFVKAGEMLVGDPYDFSSSTNTNQLQLTAFVRTNKGAFQLAQLGLTRECKMPNNYSSNYMDDYMHQPIAIKKLAIGFSAKGKLEKMQNRTNDSIQTYLQCVELGDKSGSGGFMLAKMVSMACEQIGFRGLQTWESSVDAVQCRKILLALETVDEHEPDESAYLKEEAKYINGTTSIRQKISTLWEVHTLDHAVNEFQDAFRKGVLARRRLILAFAARAYQLEKGHPPNNATDLVPAYLKTVPKDPTTGTNLALSP